MPTYESKDLTTVTYRKRTLVMYPVQRHEFDILASGYNSLHTAFCGIFFGAALTCWVTYWTVVLAEPMKSRFWLAALGFSAGAVYCLCMAIREYLKSREILDTIKAETVDVAITPTPSS
jgi:hypothetical protein